MATATGMAPAVRIKRIFQAPRDRVFAAWVEREQFEKWICNPFDETRKFLKCDIREGGSHEIEVHRPDGTIWINRAEYRTVRPPEKLVFAFEWDRFDATRKKTGEMKGTLVTVEFYDRGGATEVVLTHEFLPNEQERDAHNRGWNLTLDKLEKSVAA